MNLQTKLEIEFKVNYDEDRYPARIIIMHPLTLINLKNQLFIKLNTPLSLLGDNEYKYRGVKIFRSLDIEENKFIVK
jgi:hypothetical protein